MSKKKSNYIIGLPLYKAIVIQDLVEKLATCEESLYFNKYSELLELLTKLNNKELKK